ncbi:hypothetical protein Slin14017_G063340 [Septoria linicola]|nr:hypothetical protein Slin14017_G063340 [Septoria linicola]
MRYSLCLSALVAAVTAVALPAVSQIADGQVQAATGSPVTQIGDGQVQAPQYTGKPVQQISDGQVQNPTGTPVQQIPDGQVQNPTGKPVQQIPDGQVQNPTGTPVQQIPDGQVQNPTGTPVQQIPDGQVQNPTGKPVQQIPDGQVQNPTGTPVQQIPDGQVQNPTGTPVQQIPDGQVQNPTGKPVQQIPDGQVQNPTGSPVTQIGDGQIQAPGPQAPAPTGTPVKQIPDGQPQAPVYSQPAAPPPAPAPSSAPAPAPGTQCPVGSSMKKGPGATQPQVPFKFPLANGFPNLKVPSPELLAVEKKAQGTLPNTPLPKKLSDASATNFQLIAFNEIFEVAYFNSLLNNITSGEYDVGSGAAKDFIVKAIDSVQAQEQLHATGANAILASAGRTTIQPCSYKFPASDFDTAIATASLFTDVVLGTLSAAQTVFASTGDADVVGLIGSVIGQEGEQNGYYRATGRKIPSALPFLTGGAGAFAFSALNQLFVVPGTCGNLQDINIPILKPLTVVTPPMAADSDVTYSYPIDPSITDPSGLRLVLINQQNAPIVQELQNVKVEGQTVTFTAPFPYTNATLNGLTIAAVTNGKTSFATPDEVANAAVWGPGLIEVN